MPLTATAQDRAHMQRALALAEGGRGRVSPNPLVGAVIARGDELLGGGFHAELGGSHAEVAALEECRARGHDPAGATIYVTLEPCAHHGRTPPCAEAILAAGIARVVVGSDDPSEKASGRGPGMLRDGGVEVDFADGAEAAAARLLNQPFRKHARTGRPLVTLKSAISLDGRVATSAGDSKWISGESSRQLVHSWRAEADAICVGIGTALADDPLLSAREVDAARQPARVVFDSAARLPLDSALVASIPEAPLFVVAAPEAESQRIAALSAAGAEVLVHGGDRSSRVRSALTDLGDSGITSLLLEGGPTLAGSFLDAAEIDELRIFIAPILLGSDALPLLRGLAPERVADAQRALAIEWTPSGDDMLARARLREW